MVVPGRLALLGFALGMIFIAGCGSGLPDRDFRFYPVSGRVLLGDQLVSAGTILFSPLNDPDVIVLGKIKADGTFNLASNTSRPNREGVPGAPEGEYRVSVRIPMGKEGTGAPPTFTLPETTTIKAGTNNLTLEFAPVGFNGSPAPEAPVKKAPEPSSTPPGPPLPPGPAPSTAPAPPFPSPTSLPAGESSTVALLILACRLAAMLVFALTVTGTIGLIVGAFGKRPGQLPTAPQPAESASPPREIAKDLWAKTPVLVFGLACTLVLLATAEIMLLAVRMEQGIRHLDR